MTEEISDNIELDLIGPEDAPPAPTLDTPKPVKEKKQRKPMTPEHKAKVLAALSKAREASALSRQKKAEVKKIKKRDADEETDEIIRKDLLKKTAKNDAKDDRIAALEKQLSNITLQDVIKKPKAKKPMKVIEEEIEEEAEEEPEEEAEEEAPAIPKKTPAPVESKEVSFAQHIQQAPVINRPPPEHNHKVYRGRARRRD